MSRDDVLKQLKELGLTGEFKEEGNKTIISVEEKSDSEGPKDSTPMEAEDSEGHEKVCP